ncbi:MAG: CsbD family protein [Rhizobiaceae bacterium]|nr:CsbD family protein [Rhizobiaceae bacterium]
MNWDIVEGKWAQMKGSIQAKWGELTDDEIAEIDGNREKMVGKIQERYGRTRDEVEREVDEWLNNQ